MKLTIQVWKPLPPQERRVAQDVDLVEGQGKHMLVVDVYDAESTTITLFRAIVNTDQQEAMFTAHLDEERWQSLWQDKFNAAKETECTALQDIADVAKSNLKADTKCRLIQLLCAKHT